MEKLINDPNAIALVELFKAVFVLGLFSAISIRETINKSKEDTFLSNPNKMIGDAKNMYTSNNSVIMLHSIVNYKVEQLPYDSYLGNSSDPNKSKINFGEISFENNKITVDLDCRDLNRHFGDKKDNVDIDGIRT